MAELNRPPLGNQESQTASDPSRFLMPQEGMPLLSGEIVSFQPLIRVVGTAEEQAASLHRYLGYGKMAVLFAYDDRQWRGLQYTKRQALCQDFGVGKDRFVLSVPASAIASVRPRSFEDHEYDFDTATTYTLQREVLDVQIKTSASQAMPIRTFVPAHDPESASAVLEREHPGTWFTFCLDRTEISIQTYQ
jgi:hypothetical protein